MDHFDTLIVGCGTAGAILAARLSEDPARSVCVIEAGQDYTSLEALPPGVRSHRSARGMAASPNDPGVLDFPDWGLRGRSTRLQADIAIPRGRVIGGSSSINGAVFFRALREDLDGWSAAGMPMWSFESCLPYFKRIESDCDFADHYHGRSGPIPVHRAHREEWVPLNRAFHMACLRLGFPECADFNRPDAWGVGPLPINIHDQTRYSTAVGYLLPARHRPNLTIVAGANARRIRFERTWARCVDAEIDGRVESFCASEVIVAAGAVGSPQLLMLSGIGRSDQLERLGIKTIVHLPGVGGNLRDHPVLCASWAAIQVDLPTTGPGTPGQLGLRATTPGSTDPQDMRLVSFRVEGPHRFGIPFSLMHAASAGQLELVSDDPAVAPRIDFRHLEHPSDLVRVRSMLEVVLDIVGQRDYDGLRLNRLGPPDGELEEWMLHTVVTGHHICGTCKMGPSSDPMSVVDQTGEVRGVENLHVVDASIMPDCPRVNINATVMMMAERIAELLAA